MADTDGRINLYFDLTLPEHRKAYDLIQSQGRRSKTAFVVQAVLSQSGLSLDAVKMALAEVLSAYQVQHGGESITPPSPTANANAGLPDFIFDNLNKFG